MSAPALTCPPRFGTQRDPSRKTLGPNVSKVAHHLGKPHMPWQSYVSDVLGEIDPKTGNLYYSEGLILVPRQSGKTTLELSKGAHRCSATKFFGPRQRVVYTAQTRNKAREKLEEDFVPDLLASSTFAPRVKPHWGNGNEHVRFTNGSRFGIEANTEKAGHGGTLDEAYLDEAFADQDDRREQAFGPAMITRSNKQLLVVSTAGWLDASPYLWSKVQAGRAHIEHGTPARLAVFEWSAPEDADPGDEAAWWGCMPALGITIDIQAIRDEYDKAVREDRLNGFRRAYLNQWVPKEAAAEAAIDVDSWLALTAVATERPKPVALSVVVSEDRKWSSIGLAGKRSDGRDHLQIIQTNRGTAWVADRVAQLVKEWKPTWVAVSPSQPAGSLIAALERDRATKKVLLRVGVQELGQACGLITDAIEEGTVAHDRQPQVTVSVGAADKQRLGRSYIWKSKSDGKDISPLWALTLALYAHGKAKKPTTQSSGRRAVIL